MAEPIFNKHAQAGELHVHVSAVPGTDDDWVWFALSLGGDPLPSGGTLKTRDAAMKAAEKTYNDGNSLNWMDIGPEKSK